MAETQVNHVQNFQIMMETVTAAFGGGSKDKAGTKEIKTNDAAIAALSQLGRG